MQCYRRILEIGELVRINQYNENWDALPFAGRIGRVTQIHTTCGYVSDYTVVVGKEEVFCSEHGVDHLHLKPAKP